ncbi:MAG: alpha/beta hydrolase [Acidimicrobiia bacterium]|nr:alpha/beta hydrolase [Acidimicrobiia bacterium]
MDGVARLRVDGIDLAYDREGAGPPLLLVHGLESSRHAWGDILPTLVTDHTVVRPDARGHGDSGGPLDPAGYMAERYASDLLRLVAALDLENVVVVGHSFGGTCALLAAREDPDAFAGLVLVNTWTYGLPEQMRQKPLAYLDAISKRGILGIYDMTPAIRSGHPTEGPRYDEPAFAAARRAERANLRPEGFVALAAQNLSRPSFHESLSAVRLPVLLLVGEHDEVMRVPMAVLAHILEGSELVTIPGSAHNPTFDAPKALASHIVEFARRVQGDEAGR